MQANAPGGAFPETSRDQAQILAEMRALQQQDADWENGRTWSLVYHWDAVADFVKQAHNLYFSTNGLNPTAFPSLRKFETEVVAMVADLLNGGPEATGTMTAGGTESILLAVKAARDYARENGPARTAPEILLPQTVHPAFEKAAHLLNLNTRHYQLREDYRADPDDARAKVNENTILLVGSAPAYPHGVIDPIQELGALAQEHNLLFHVDGCIGGMMLPFLEMNGHTYPPFDFRVPGVTSMSCDLHKYGYAAKGASSVIYRKPELRRYQFYAYTEWPGGIYASTTTLGTRPGGSIAAAWAILNHLGKAGYKELARRTYETTQRLQQGIQQLPGMRILGAPDMTIFSFTSDQDDIYSIGDELSLRGWFFDRQQAPASLHISVMINHENFVDDFLEDLHTAVREVNRPTLQNLRRNLGMKVAKQAIRTLPDKWVSKLTQLTAGKLQGNGSPMPKRSAAMYGMMGELPNRGDLNTMVLDMLEQLNEVPAPNEKTKAAE